MPEGVNDLPESIAPEHIRQYTHRSRARTLLSMGGLTKVRK